VAVRYGSLAILSANVDDSQPYLGDLYLTNLFSAVQPQDRKYACPVLDESGKTTL